MPGLTYQLPKLLSLFFSESGLGPSIFDYPLEPMGTVPSTQAASSDDEYMAALQASSAALQALNTRIYSSARDRDRDRSHRGGSANTEHDDSPTHSDESIAEEVIAGSEQPPGCDSHRWRKYGCKHIRATKDFRNYYKCSVKDCNVKKIEHVHFTVPGAPPSIKIQIRVRITFVIDRCP